jgi:hypothetical protein
MAAGWFPRETHGALEALCRHTCRSRVLAAQVTKVEKSCLKTEEGLRVLDRLLAMLERETRAITALLRTMRLTQQARIDARSAGRARSGPQASYYEMQEAEDEQQPH